MKDGKSRGALRRWLLKGLAAACMLIAGGAGYSYFKVRQSLPLLQGEIALVGLAADVAIERDSLGVASIRGRSRADVAFATGFLHAQERFFQMDLMRRHAAGELSELFDRAVVDVDRGVRIHQFRTRARRQVENASAADRTFLHAYTRGVNAGLGALGAPPFEYLALQSRPVPWREEDSLLVAAAMSLILEDSEGSLESDLGLMEDLLPKALADFLAPRGTPWDAALDGSTFDPVPIPGPEVFDARDPGESSAPARPAGLERGSETPGSNNWALAGRLTRHGGAILANDMHLPLNVPNAWYRVSFLYPGADGHESRVIGVTLPGTPIIVAGSNGKVAWGITASAADFSDLVIVEPAPGVPGSYMTPSGPRAFSTMTETIVLKKGGPVTFDIKSTVWGPVIDADHRGRKRALRWTAHDEDAVNLVMTELESAAGVEQALDIASRSGSPHLNFVAADSGGRIGWTLTGRIPRRFGHDGRAPRSWASGGKGWDGWLPPAECPRIVDPAIGRLWTANGRPVGGTMLDKLGDGGFALGARGRQIRGDLLAIEQASEADMLRVQLDDGALFLKPWRDLLLEVLTPEAVVWDPRRGELRKHLEQWGGHASVDSVGYRMVRAFRQAVDHEVFESLTAILKKVDGRFQFDRLSQREAALWALVNLRPPHFLGAGNETWDELLLKAADGVLDRFLAKKGERLADHPWGERNTSLIRHPLSRAFAPAGRFLDMKREPLPGDQDMPRVQGPGFGASMRMVVSPGREEAGIFHMPCGQSGHPLSAHFDDGHAAWAEGRAAPFLPGKTVHVLRLKPAA